MCHITYLPPFDPPGLVDAAEPITSGVVVVVVVVEVCVSVEVDVSSSGNTDLAEENEIISGDVVEVFLVVDEVECGISKVCFDPSCILKIVFIHFSLFKK